MWKDDKLKCDSSPTQLWALWRPTPPSGWWRIGLTSDLGQMDVEADSRGSVWAPDHSTLSSAGRGGGGRACVRGCGMLRWRAEPRQTRSDSDDGAWSGSCWDTIHRESSNRPVLIPAVAKEENKEEKKGGGGVCWWVGRGGMFWSESRRAAAAGGMRTPRRPRRTLLLPRLCIGAVGLLAAAWLCHVPDITGDSIDALIPYSRNKPPTSHLSWYICLSAHFVPHWQFLLLILYLSIWFQTLVRLNSSLYQKESWSSKKTTRLTVKPDVVIIVFVSFQNKNLDDIKSIISIVSLSSCCASLHLYGPPSFFISSNSVLVDV